LLVLAFACSGLPLTERYIGEPTGASKKTRRDDFDTEPVELPRLLEKISALLRNGG
jgi:hypothetical protein